METVAIEIIVCYSHFPRREDSPCHARPHEEKAEVIRRKVE